MALSAVAFDIDGTMYSNRDMFVRSARYALSHYRFLRGFAQMRKHIRDVYPILDFRTTQAEILGEILGIDSADAKERIDRWINVELDVVYRKLTPYRYLGECLAELRDRGLRLGVLSDFPIGAKLGYLGFPDIWDCTVSSEDTGYLKPRPEPFDALCRGLDASPEQIVYIGNNYEYDIIGAANRGLKTGHLTRIRRRKSVANIEFSDYRRLVPSIVELGRL